jgi:hypothetical protein
MYVANISWFIGTKSYHKSILDRLEGLCLDELDEVDPLLDDEYEESSKSNIESEEEPDEELEDDPESK